MGGILCCGEFCYSSRLEAKLQLKFVLFVDEIVNLNLVANLNK